MLSDPIDHHAACCLNNAQLQHWFIGEKKTRKTDPVCEDVFQHNKKALAVQYTLSGVFPAQVLSGHSRENRSLCGWQCRPWLGGAGGPS